MSRASRGSPGRGQRRTPEGTASPARVRRPRRDDRSRAAANTPPDDPAASPAEGAVLTAERPEAATGGGAPRRPRPEIRRWPWILGAALTAALLIAAGVVVFFTPLLGLKSVAVVSTVADAAGSSTASDGLDPTVDAAVRVAAGDPDGTPLARVDLSAIADRVSAIPQIEDVEVSRSWPNSVTVTVTPRVPIAVTSANGQLWLVDARGQAYLPVPAAPAGLVTLKLATPGPGDPATEAALTVVESFTDAFRGQVATVSARTAFDVQLTLTDGRTVIWGGADQSARKMQVLPALLEQKGSTYVITDPSLVSVR